MKERRGEEAGPEVRRRAYWRGTPGAMVVCLCVCVCVCLGGGAGGTSSVMQHV